MRCFSYCHPSITPLPALPDRKCYYYYDDSIHPNPPANGYPSLFQNGGPSPLFEVFKEYKALIRLIDKEGGFDNNLEFTYKLTNFITCSIETAAASNEREMEGEITKRTYCRTKKTIDSFFWSLYEALEGKIDQAIRGEIYILKLRYISA